MNVIRCKNGHFFDGDSYSACPHCGESAMTDASTVPVKDEKRGFWGRGRKDKEVDVQPIGITSSIVPRGGDYESGNTPTDVIAEKATEEDSAPVLKKNPTLDFWQTSSHSETGTSDNKTNEKASSPDIAVAETGGEKLNADAVIENSEVTQPDANKPEAKVEETKTQEGVSSLREAVRNASASNEGKTMSYFSSAVGSASAQDQPRRSSDPVVGWLICVGGCHFGECFSIYAGKNSVGRSEENRIVVSGDNGISRTKHALIVYEPKKRNFFIQPGDSSGLTYLNEDYITESRLLAAKDIIELGDSKFMFVPLCGKEFSWEEYMPKGE